MCTIERHEKKSVTPVSKATKFNEVNKTRLIMPLPRKTE